MDIKAARRVSEEKGFGVFKRLRGGSMNNTVCKYWLAGRCNRDPCRFLHPQHKQFYTELPSQKAKQFRESPEDRLYPTSKTWRRDPENAPNKSSVPLSTKAGSEGRSTRKCNILKKSSVHPMTPDNNPKQIYVSLSSRAGSESGNTRITPDNNPKISFIPPSRSPGSEVESTQKAPVKICQYWMLGNCVQGDKCQDLHSWFCGNGFSMVAKLEGHNKAVNGIALCSDKLYSGSDDKSMRIWDCHTGLCVGVVNLEGVVGSLISEGPWLFAGLPNVVKAWNIDTHKDLTLKQPVGEVYAMVVGNEMLFAGTRDGTIFVYKSSSETNCPELAASMKGHSGSVVSLAIGANRLYSGSLDRTIRVWDLDTLQCIQTLNGHTDDVKSVICWDNFLLSCSLDGTIKVWAVSEGGNLEVYYSHNVECGAIALCGIHDAEAKPILLCSCNDNSVRLYDLPSFDERGRIFAKKEVRAIQIGPGGLFFTGDATGELCVWKLSGELIPAVC